MIRTFVFVTAILVPALAWGQKEKTESFDRDPGWEGVNNRPRQEAVAIKQDFGWSQTDHAGALGEIGGLVTAAGEAAYYGLPTGPHTLADKLTASGTIYVGPGGSHLLVGFFNKDTVGAWRTPNTLALRINGRGDDHFYAYVEYCTSKWRAGGDTTPFPRETRDDGQIVGFATRRAVPWTLTYDPRGDTGRGVITATIDGKEAACVLDEGHKSDGAALTHFGILNVAKSADNSGLIYIEDLILNGRRYTFDRDPRGDEKGNRTSYRSTLVRPWFDFGYAPSRIAGGRRAGELGGRVFRGDCRWAERMACYGDTIGPLTLDKPFRASGKIAMTRAVSDSTTLFGFYHSRASMTPEDSQASGIPRSVIGVHIEGPSREGYLIYPVWRSLGGASGHGMSAQSPHIYPDGVSHDWSFEYNPDGADGRGQITVTFDGKSSIHELEKGFKESGAKFDRFGIVTNWVDGNSQDVYWDDMTYTVEQE
jgi:hypothetical protein